MKTQTRLGKRWILVSVISVIVLATSAYFLTLPLAARLQLFCPLDDAHIAQEPPVFIPGYWAVQYTRYVNGYWTSPHTGTNLTMITIWEAIDAGMWLYYSNTENTFWIAVQKGPMKNTWYGPYQGTLWTLANAINPIATAGITVSTITLVYSSMRAGTRRKSKPPELNK